VESFTGEPHLLYTNEKREATIAGIASTSAHLYIVRRGVNLVEVFDKELFKVRSRIYIPGVLMAW